MVVCPNCGLGSAGSFFCPRCSSLLTSPAGGPPPQVALPDGRAVDCSAWQGRWPADGWRPLLTTCAGAPCRAYALSPERWRELGAAVRERAAFSLDVLTPVTVAEVEGGAVVVAEALPGCHRPLADPPAGEDELALLEATFA